MPQEPGERVSESQVELAKIIEKGRTQRYLTVCATIAIGTICITVAVVYSMTPSWVTIVTSLIGPAGLVLTLLKLFREYIVRSNKKFQVMEKLVDRNRTSSDGSIEPK